MQIQRGDYVSKTLLEIFHVIDPNFETRKECKSGSTYFTVGALKIRVSTHFKKSVSDLVDDISLILPYGSRSYLVLIQDSVFPIQMSCKQLRIFLESENMRKSLYFPQITPTFEIAECTDNDEEVPTYDPKVLPAGLPSPLYKTWERTCECSNISKLTKNEEFGAVIKMAYFVAGKEYRARDYTLWVSFEGSFAELVKEIKNLPDNLVHRKK